MTKYTCSKCGREFGENITVLTISYVQGKDSHHYSGNLVFCEKCNEEFLRPGIVELSQKADLGYQGPTGDVQSDKCL